MYVIHTHIADNSSIIEKRNDWQSCKNWIDLQKKEEMRANTPKHVKIMKNKMNISYWILVATSAIIWVIIFKTTYKFDDVEFYAVRTHTVAKWSLLSYHSTQSLYLFLLFFGHEHFFVWVQSLYIHFQMAFFRFLFFFASSNSLSLSFCFSLFFFFLMPFV